MQTVLLSLVVVAVAAVAASPVVEESRHQKELREHYHHLSYIAEYSCHHPQARTVPVHELLSPYQTRGKAFFPEVTVLHRCDVFAGCCELPKKCGPLHADSIHLPFKVTYLEDMGHHHKGEWEMEYFSFDNHTVCGCDHHSGYKTVDHHDLDHHDHEVHEHKDHYKGHDHHEDRDHDHYNHDHHATYPKDKFKPVVEEEQHDEPRPERRRDQPNKKIDSLYITI